MQFFDGFGNILPGRIAHILTLPHAKQLLMLGISIHFCSASIELPTSMKELLQQ